MIYHVLMAGSPAAVPERRSNAARLFGYDVFISFALGPPPRGSRSYASDLARRLRERDFTVFFSEEEAPAGGHLDDTLKRALHRSRTLVAIINHGTLTDPRWVRAEVEEFRRANPERSIIPINIGGALQDPALGAAAEPWLRFSDRIWIDELQSAGDEGVTSDRVLERLATAPRAFRAATRWRLTVRAAFAVLSIVTAAAIWFAWSDRRNANLALERRAQAERNAAEARTNADLARANEARAEENAANALRESKRAVAAEGEALMEAAAARAAERLALSGRLAAESQLARERDPRLALLWAHEAWTLEPTMEARRALYSALHEPVAIRLPGGTLGDLLSLDYSDDGRSIAASGGKREVHVWNAVTRRPVKTLHTKAWVRGIAFSPDGRTLASADSEGVVQLWDAATGAPLGEPLVHPEVTAGWAVTWSRDGSLLAFAGIGSTAQRRIVVWDAASRLPVAEPLRSDDQYGTFKLSFSPDAKLLASTALSEIEVWNVMGGCLHVPPIRTRTAPRHVLFLDDDTIAFDGPRYEVTRWSLDDGKAAEPSFEGHSNWIGSFAHAPAARIVATGSEDMTIRLWRDYHPSPVLGPLRTHSYGVRELDFGPDGTTLASAAPDGVFQWLLNVGAHRFKRANFRVPGREDGDTTISDDGHWLVLLRESGGLEWHDLNAGRMAASVADVKASHGLAVARDGTVALKPYQDRLLLHGRGERRPRCTIEIRVDDAAFSPDSGLLVTSTVDPLSLQLWRASDCHALATIPRSVGPDAGWSPFDFAADGHSLFVVDDKVIRRWNIAERRFDGRTAIEAAHALSIDAHGPLVASAHPDGIVRLARLDSAVSPVLLQGPHGHTTVRHVTFSPDGVWLASVADDGQVVLWDLTANQPAGPSIDSGQGQLRFAVFSSDSKSLLTMGTDGAPKWWQIDPEAWAGQACRTAQRNLTCSEWQRVRGTQPYRKTCPAWPLPDDAALCAR